MIQIIVNAFVEEGKEIAVVEVLFASGAEIGRASCRERV